VTPAASDGLVSGRYRLGDLLGTGGSASVFEAVDTCDGSAVALKLLHPHLAQDAAARAALTREARAAGAVHHPNVVAVLAVSEPHDPLAWIALELVRGVSLAEHVDLHGEGAVPDALGVARAVLGALVAVHAAGIVHRDVSPSNIIVAPTADGGIDVEGVRLVDFGLADAAGTAGPGGDRVVGNPNFVSPEQATGDTIDVRADVYQAGAVLYFALTGAPPFARASAAETMRAHVSSPPAVPSVRHPRIARGVDRLVVRAMLKRPEERYQSATAMLTALEALAPEKAAPDSRTLVLATPTTRMRRVAAPRAVAAVPIAAESPAERSVPEAQPTSGPGTWRIVAAALVVTALVGWVLSATSATPVRPSDDTTTVASAPSPVATATPQPDRARPEEEPLPVTPDVSGTSIVDAGVALAAAGLVAGAITEEPSVFAAGTVLRSDPGAETPLPPGTAVGLVVASGMNTVPAVAGLSRDAAIAAIQNAGFGVLLAVVTDASAPRGTLLGSEPAGSTPALLGRAITILVATSTATAPTATPTPTGTPDPATG
jgi:serine/threonine protein kinase